MRSIFFRLFIPPITDVNVYLLSFFFLKLFVIFGEIINNKLPREKSLISVVPQVL